MTQRSIRIELEGIRHMLDFSSGAIHDSKACSQFISARGALDFLIRDMCWEDNLEASMREHYTDVLLKYDPDQPRDDHGRWGDGSGKGSFKEISATEAQKEGFVYHGTRQSGIRGEENLKAIKDSGMKGGQFLTIPHSEYGPPWVAIRIKDLPPHDSWESKTSPGPDREHGKFSSIYEPHWKDNVNIPASDLYLADAQGNITGKLK